jgi:hypothetical protein
MTVTAYQLQTLMVIVGQAGIGLIIGDIAGEWFVKLSQVWYSYGNNISSSHIDCNFRPGWQRNG